MANKYSSLTPHNYSFNNPAMFNDPSCAEPWDDGPYGGNEAYYYAMHMNEDGRSRDMDPGGGGTMWHSTGSQSYRGVGQSLSNYGSGSGMTMGSFSSALSTLSHSTWGGTWSSNGQASIFGTYADAVSAGIDYNFSHNSWGNTVPKSYGAAAQAFENVTGIRFLPSVTIEEARSNTNFLNDRLNALTQGGGSLWISSGQNALDIFGGLAGAAQGLVVGNDSWLGKNGKYYSNDWQGNQYAGSRSGAYRAAATYRNLGRASIAGTVVLGGVLIYNGYEKDGSKFGYNAQYATASTTGGLVGGWAGASAGATVGAAVGVWFFGVGAVPGAIIGAGFGLAGGIIGGLVGSSVGGSAVDYYHGR